MAEARPEDDDATIPDSKSSGNAGARGVSSESSRSKNDFDQDEESGS